MPEEPNARPRGKATVAIAIEHLSLRTRTPRLADLRISTELPTCTKKGTSRLIYTLPAKCA